MLNLSPNLIAIHGLTVQRREILMVLSIRNGSADNRARYKYLVTKTRGWLLWQVLLSKYAMYGDHALRVQVSELDRAIDFHLDKEFISY